jgi:hypothetical protein
MKFHLRISAGQGDFSHLPPLELPNLLVRVRRALSASSLVTALLIA